MEERILDVGNRKYTEVTCTDEPTFGGACHSYIVVPVDVSKVNVPPPVYARVSFQKGPVKENGVNGCHNEDLIAIVIDRLKMFQQGDYSCRENALALTKLEEAMMWLNNRTSNREKRGVEGTRSV